jgi:VanZ family protein
VASSIIPPSTITRLDISMARLDWVMHAVSYGILAILLARALETSGIGTVLADLLAIVGVLALGAGLEVAQPLVNRSGELIDWFADGVGAVVGLGIRAAWRSLVAEPA